MEKYAEAFYDCYTKEELDDKIKAFIEKHTHFVIIDVSVTSAYNPKDGRTLFTGTIKFSYKEQN